MKRDADVIIAGGGPAGSMLGYHLVKKGLSTIILEKCKFPRYKACGGGVSLKAIQNIPFDIQPVIERIPTGGILNFAGEQCFKIDLQEDFAWLTMRSVFDAFLIGQAVKEGADFHDEEPVLSFEENDDGVVVKTSQREYRGKFLAGADGVHSPIARGCGLMKRRETGVAIEAELEVSPEALDEFGAYAVFDFGAISHGYGWFFPKHNHISAGIFSAKTGKAPDLQKILAEHINRHPLLKGATISHLQGHLIPLGGRKQPLHGRRVLLVGDAANLADPWLGEGIYYAITSAAIAAQTFEENITKDVPDLSRYSQEINRKLVADFRACRTFAALVYRFPLLSSRLLSSSPIMQRAVFGVIRGDYDFHRLRRYLVLKSPCIINQAIQKGKC